MRRASLAAAGLLAPASSLLAAGPLAAADYRIEIAEIDWEIAPKKKIRTTAYDGQIPGRLLRLAEGKPVTIEIVNRTDHAEIVHWHGQWILVEADGSMEEGSPMIPAGRLRSSHVHSPPLRTALVSHPRHGQPRLQARPLHRPVRHDAG